MVYVYFVHLTATTNINHEQIVELPFRQSHSENFKIFPRAIPDDVADRLLHFHGNPPVWWVGQFTKYAMRPNKVILQFLKERQTVNFTTPIVG